MLFLIVKFLVATINDSPCFVKIAIFSQNKRACHRQALLFWLWRDSNHNRTPRWGVHRPAQTLVDTFISFPRPPAGGKEMQENLSITSEEHHKVMLHRIDRGCSSSFSESNPLRRASIRFR